MELALVVSPETNMMTEIEPGMMPQNTLRCAGRAIAGSATVTLVAYFGIRLHVNFATTGFLHLLIVVLVAMMAGFWEATVTSLAALVCLNYFFVPPVYSFYVADAQNWVALLAFESTALLVSRLSIQLEKQARTAVSDRRGMEKLSEMDDDEVDRVEQASDFQLNSRLGCQAVVKGDVVVTIPEWNRNYVSEGAH